MVLDEPICLFSAEIERRDGSFVVEVPASEVDLGAVAPGDLYRAALFPPARAVDSMTTGSTAADRGRSGASGGSAPPVQEGDRCRVTIEDLGEQGDGLARIGPGYVVFVPGTTVGEEVNVEITDARENFAFAEITPR